MKGSFLVASLGCLFSLFWFSRVMVAFPRYSEVGGGRELEFFLFLFCCCCCLSFFSLFNFLFD
jgi:hypothetical protein